MKRSVAAGAGLLLLLGHPGAFAGSDRVAQADTAGAATPGSGAAAPVAPDAAANPGLPPIDSIVPPEPAPTVAQPTPPALAPQQFTGTQRNNSVTTPSRPMPSLGALPYGGTQATVGVQNPVAVQPYGGTQRDSVGSMLGDAAANGGVQTYTGTQSTLGGPQNLGNAGQPTSVQPSTGQPYGNQPYGVQTTNGSQRNGALANVGSPGAATPNGGDVQGNGTTYGRAPLGSAPVTRDQTGVFGGVGSYNARGVYTGVAPQPLAYGQIYATDRGVAGGLLGTGVNATGPLRQVVPPVGSPIRPNSGYGLPNGSKPSYMDARGIQRPY